MINFITRNFSSLWSFVTSPFRAIWHLIVHIFPPREITVMDTPRGNVYTYQQGSFWRFTRFCAKVGLVIWATWSTYVFVYHRPMLQKRTKQLEEMRAMHDRHMADLQTYLTKFNELTRNLNVNDDKILHAEKLNDKQKEELLNTRLKTWGEMDFLRTRLTEMFTNSDYAPEYTKMAELSAEWELTRAENEAIKKQNDQMAASMQDIAEADSQIVDVVSKMLTPIQHDHCRPGNQPNQKTILAKSLACHGFFLLKNRQRHLGNRKLFRREYPYLPSTIQDYNANQYGHHGTKKPWRVPYDIFLPV